MPGPTDDEDILELGEDQQLNPENDPQHDDLEGGPTDDRGETDDDAGSGNDDESGEDDGAEETVVSFGDAADVDQEGDSGLIKALRKQLRDAKEVIRNVAKPAPVARELRPEPTSADHAFDDDAFKADYKAWLDEKAEIEGEQRQAATVQQENDRHWAEDVRRFETQKAELKFDDLDDAQDAVSSSLNWAQQAAIVKAAEKPALFFYALGKSPAKLAELAKITDVIKFAAAVAKMEGSVTVTKRRKGPTLDRPQRGSGAIVSSDKKLAQLEKQAEETGERTELVNYKRDMAKRAAKKK